MGLSPLKGDFLADPLRHSMLKQEAKKTLSAAAASFKGPVQIKLLELCRHGRYSLAFIHLTSPLSVSCTALLVCLALSPADFNNDCAAYSAG